MKPREKGKVDYSLEIKRNKILGAYDAVEFGHPNSFEFTMSFDGSYEKTDLLIEKIFELTRIAEGENNAKDN